MSARVGTSSRTGYAGCALSLVLVAAAPAPAPASDRHRWKAVHDATFDYSACYPADLFRPAGASLNVGGQDYVGRGGARLQISGLANQYGDSLAVTAQQTIPNGFGLKRTVTYTVVKPNWAVLSGTLPGGRSFYQRVIRKGKDFAFFFLSYPSNQSATYDAIVGQLGQCLR